MGLVDLNDYWKFVVGCKFYAHFSIKLVSGLQVFFLGAKASEARQIVCYHCAGPSKTVERASK